MKSKNIIIAASGTGGHIYPGIALAQEMSARGYIPVFFIGNNEASVKIIENTGFKYVRFDLSGMPRKISFSFFIFLIKLCAAFCKALIKTIMINPCAVVGVGGYVSVPAVFAAKLCFKKTFIHEQNTVPGAANRLLNFFVDKTLISFKDSVKYFKNKKNVLHTGYPVRKDILNASKQKAFKLFNFDKDIFTLMVFGGSLGALKLNENAFEAVKLLEKKTKIQVIHITGKTGYDEIKNKTNDNKNYLVFDYMHNIADAYAVSDIVVCRSGAGTVFELLLLEKPAVLIPYPYAAANHQYHNAKEVSREGLTVFEEEKNITPQKLAALIEILREKLQKNGDDNKIKKDIVYPQEKMSVEIIKIISKE